jgi:hypothetical protein
MARNVLVDAGFVVALLSRRDNHHEWAVTQASEWPPPWSTRDAFRREAGKRFSKSAESKAPQAQSGYSSSGTVQYRFLER